MESKVEICKSKKNSEHEKCMNEEMNSIGNFVSQWKNADNDKLLLPIKTAFMLHLENNDSKNVCFVARFLYDQLSRRIDYACEENFNFLNNIVPHVMKIKALANKLRLTRGKETKVAFFFPEMELIRLKVALAKDMTQYKLANRYISLRRLHDIECMKAQIEDKKDELKKLNQEILPAQFVDPDPLESSEELELMSDSLPKNLNIIDVVNELENDLNSLKDLQFEENDLQAIKNVQSL